MFCCQCLSLLALSACAPERDVHGLGAGVAGERMTTAVADADADGGGVDVSAEYSGRRKMQGPLQGTNDGGEVRRTATRVFFEPLPDGGSVLRLVEEGPEAFRMRFDVPGRLGDDGGWAGQDEEIRISIDKRGVLTGTAYEPPFRITFDGKVSDQRFVLHMEMKATAAAGPMPAGTRFVYDYDLKRDLPATGRTARADDGRKQGKPVAQGDCKRIRWKLKNVMDYGSGTIDLVRVPVCEDR